MYMKGVIMLRPKLALHVYQCMVCHIYNCSHDFSFGVTFRKQVHIANALMIKLHLAIRTRPQENTGEGIQYTFSYSS